MSAQSLHRNNIEKIKLRRIEFRNRNNSNLIEQIKSLREEIVKISFSAKPDLQRHKSLLAELNKINAELKSSQAIRTA